MNPKSKYFRISLTEKCNFGCYFCHNEGQSVVSRKKSALNAEDFIWVSKAAHEFGYRKFKLTGGEPTLNPEILEIVKGISTLAESDLSMITNGSRLITMAGPLRDAGLKRLNVSLYTLDPAKFRKNNGGNERLLERVLRGIRAAVEVGFRDIKINYIWDETSTPDEFYQICDYAGNLGLTVVLLPVMKSVNNLNLEESTLEELYLMVSALGIVSEAKYHDNEGIRKRLIRLENGTAVILRDEELKNKLPFNKCIGCAHTAICREGIFPTRLSAAGSILPCLADDSMRFDASEAIKNRSQAAIHEIFSKVENL